MIKQIIPEGHCLKCKGCCRFKEADSAWVPTLLAEEALELIDKDLPPVAISKGKKLMAVPSPEEGSFICPFLKLQGNACAVYSTRPFECQLYPFLIAFRHTKIILTVDLNCPWVQENMSGREFKEYTGYLSAHLNTPAVLYMLKDNPQVLQAYEQVSEIVELGPT